MCGKLTKERLISGAAGRKRGGNKKLAGEREQRQIFTTFSTNASIISVSIYLSLSSFVYPSLYKLFGSQTLPYN